jgi:predicted transcriptional regulator
MDTRRTTRGGTLGCTRMDMIRTMTVPDNRNRIQGYIRNNPGSHLRKISKELAIALGDTQYHLNFLEKTGLVKSKRMGMYKVYYTFSILEERDESILAILQQETPREIIVYLVEHPGSTQGEIAEHMDFSPPTINWHMSQLIESGIIRSRKEKQFVKYHIEVNIKDITTLLKLYHPGVWSKLSSRLADIFLDLASSSGLETSENKMTNEKKLKTQPQQQRQLGEEDQKEEED